MCRVSKFNPVYRNELDNYTLDEWTSISDVGKKYKGKVFSLKDYFHTENDYIITIKNFLMNHDARNFFYYELEDYSDDGLDERDRSLYDDFKALKTRRLNEGQIEIVAKLVLREVIWCKLKNDVGDEIYFAYDYYMYFNSKNGIYNFNSPSGVYVEPNVGFPILDT